MSWADLSEGALRATTSALGESIRYRAAPTEPWQDVQAIFSDAHEIAAVVQGVEVSTTAPMAAVIDTDLDAPPRKGAQVEARGRLYDVAEPPQPDGEGGSKLILRRAS